MPNILLSCEVPSGTQQNLRGRGSAGTEIRPLHNAARLANAPPDTVLLSGHVDELGGLDARDGLVAKYVVCSTLTVPRRRRLTSPGQRLAPQPHETNMPVERASPLFPHSC